MSAGPEPPAREPGDRPVGETSVAVGERPERSDGSRRASHFPHPPRLDFGAGFSDASAVEASARVEPVIRMPRHVRRPRFSSPSSGQACERCGPGLDSHADDGTAAEPLPTVVVVTATRVDDAARRGARARHRDRPRDDRAQRRERCGGAAALPRGTRRRAQRRARPDDVRCSFAAPRATTRWCSSMACASTPAPSACPALQNIPPDMIERIEVVKGPRSALWGSDAIGGVVNVVTRRGSRDGWVAEAGYGDYDTRKASLNGGFDLGQSAGLDFGVSWLDSDGFPTRHRRHHGSRLRQPERERCSCARRRVGRCHGASLAHGRQHPSTPDFFLAPGRPGLLTSTTAAEAEHAGRRRPASTRRGEPLEDEIEQNQPPDFRRDGPQHVRRASIDWKLRGARRSASARCTAHEDARAASRSAQRFERDTDSVNVYVQDRIAAGPHLRAAGARLHRSRDGGLRA